jgi:hypothetical protein
MRDSWGRGVRVMCLRVENIKLKDLQVGRCKRGESHVNLVTYALSLNT